jgi:hypothetical protein
MAPTALSLTRPQHNEGAEVETLSQDGEPLFRHKLGAEPRQTPLVQVGILGKQQLSNYGVDETIANKLESLVIVYTKASMGQRSNKQARLFKLIANDSLQGCVLWFHCKSSQIRLLG